MKVLLTKASDDDFAKIVQINTLEELDDLTALVGDYYYDIIDSKVPSYKYYCKEKYHLKEDFDIEIRVWNKEDK